MIRNYLKIALRNLLRQKGFSLINIFGLAIGFAACLMIVLYILQEISFDKFHKNRDRIYRVIVQTKSSRGESVLSETPMPVAPAFANDYPEIEKFSRIAFWDKFLITNGEKKFIESKIVFADSAFFDIFSFSLLSGNKTQVLNSPYKIIFTESAAKKYFGNENPVGKQVMLAEKFPFLITGVVKDAPINSHFHFDFIASYSSLNKEFLGWDGSNQWGQYFGSYTYVLLRKGTDLNNLRAKTKDWLDSKSKHTPDESHGVDFQAISDIHLKSANQLEIEPPNSIQNLIIIALIGIFLLVIASINFVNLTTARAIRRSREVGIRKTIGAFRFQLVQQFLGETFIIVLIAFAISIVLLEIFMPHFSKLIGVEVKNNINTNPLFLFVIALVLLLVGILAGSYPAFVLSNFKPISVLKGSNSGKPLSGNTIRKTLVIVQFSISILLIISTLVINKQLKYFRDSYLGFNKDYIVEIAVEDEKVKEKLESFKNDLAKIPGVINYTACFQPPISNSQIVTPVYPNGRDVGNGINAEFSFSDTAYIDHFGFKLLAGRNFYQGMKSDSTSVIINETLMKKLGFNNPNDVIGRTYDSGLNRTTLRIIGVIKDYHNNSFQTPIAPAGLMNWSSLYRTVSVRLSSKDIPATLAKLKDLWNKYSLTYPFTFEFLDESINNFYVKEERQGNIVVVFSLISIIIACLGLLGLASYTTEQRTKEIGVRKVLGASTTGIFYLLVKDFLKLVALSGLIASPIAYYLMNKWLNDFAYKINITYDVFLSGCLIAVLIAIITIGYQAVRSARCNPVNSLKYE